MAEAVQAGGGVGVKALAVVAAGRARFVSMPAGRRSWVVGAVVGVVGLALAMAWYAGRPDWRVLFSGLEGKDVSQVSQELGAAGIAFQTTSDGAGIEVPAESLDKARMEVAAKGMPGSGRLGFELFDKPNWVGSEFDERVNYQRALEGELEHTIATLGVVRSARVHLVLSQASLFSAEQKEAKASVVLKLKRASLGAEETESIRNLVAGAVENLSPEQVTLVDADGRVNLQRRAGGAAEADVEQAMEAKLVAMLEPLAGAGNVRATVNVSYDHGTEERTDEVYDPTGSVPLTSQKSEQTTAGGRGLAQGVPGTASNSPGAAAAGGVAGSQAAASPGTPPLLQKESLPVYPQGGSAGGGVKQESGTFAVSRHLTHTEEGPGRVKRVTAAVVVNDRMLTEGTGSAMHSVWKPRTPEEMHRLEGLAQAAVGFDVKRGDEVVMENVGFSSNVPEVQPAGMAKVMDEAKGMLGHQPGMLRTVTLGLLGVLLVMFVLRPVAKQVAVTLMEQPALTAGTVEVMKSVTTSSTAGIEAGAAGKAELPSAADESAEMAAAKPRRMRAITGNAVFDHVSEQIRREPDQTTRLLETWIGSEQENA